MNTTQYTTRINELAKQVETRGNPMGLNQTEAVQWFVAVKIAENMQDYSTRDMAWMVMGGLNPLPLNRIHLIRMALTGSEDMTYTEWAEEVGVDQVETLMIQTINSFIEFYDIKR